MSCPNTAAPRYEVATTPPGSRSFTYFPFTVARTFDDLSIAAFADTVWITETGIDTHVRILVSHDGGREFSPLSTSGWGVFCFAEAASSHALWGFCTTGMMGYAVRSTNGGRTFHQVLGPTGPVPNSASIIPLSDDVAVFEVPLSPDVWVTRDGGQHFESVLSLPGGGLSVSFASPTTWLAWGAGDSATGLDRLWRSVNAGRSWSAVPLPDL
jgi:hypothetical protein